MAFRLEIRLPEPVNGKPPALIGVAGLSVLLRILVGAFRHGAGQIDVTGPGLEDAKRAVSGDPRLAGADISWGPRAKPDPELARAEIEAGVVVGPAVWKEFSEATGAVTVPGAPLMVKHGRPGEVPKPLWADGAALSSTHYVVPVTDSASARKAKSAIFKGVFKPTSGPVSVHFNSKLSIPLSWMMSETFITPNMITVTTTLIGFVSAWMFSRGSWTGLFWGGTLFQLCAALDRCDGEMARSKFMDSPNGAWIDTFGDNLTYVAYLIGLTLGYSRFAAPFEYFWSPYVRIIGFGSLAMTVFLLGGMYLYLHRNKKSGTLVAVYKDFEARVDAKKAGFVYRFLDRIKILGKRDSWSLAVGVVSWLGAIPEIPFFYHLLFFATVGTIVLMNIYFTVARRNVGG